MREKNRKPIASIKKLPQFTTMNVIDGQAGLISYFSLIFYSLTIDNILNIIIIIILATVTINMAFGENGLIREAELARDLTANSLESEQEGMNIVVAEYANLIKEDGEILIPRKWSYVDKETVTNGVVTAKIGDYINYDCTDGATTKTYTSLASRNGSADQTFNIEDYEYGWRIFDIDEGTGELIIIPEEIMLRSDGNYYFLTEQAGYNNGIEELTNICAIYGEGKWASKAECMVIEDINKRTGYNPNNTGVYDPEQIGTGRKAYEGTVMEYGNTLTYYWDGSDRPYYDSTNGSKGNTGVIYTNGFSWHDGSKWNFSPVSSTATTSAMEKITDVTINTYQYYPTTLTENATGNTVGLPTTSILYEMLFVSKHRVGTDTEYIRYILASPTVGADLNRVYYCFKIVVDGFIKPGGGEYYSSGSVDGVPTGIRPKVYLQTTISPQDSGEKIDGCTVWNLD